MSLTSHLSDRSSRVRRFIHDCAPGLAEAGTRGVQGREAAAAFRFDALTSLENHFPAPPKLKSSGGYAGVAGTAFDYRVRMDLPGFDSDRTMAIKGLQRLALNTSVVPRGKHIHERLSMELSLAATFAARDPSHASLAIYSIILAWCESIARVGPTEALSGDLGRRVRRAKGAGDLVSGIEDELLFDVIAMRYAVTSIVDQWNEAIEAGVPYSSNPGFIGALPVGGADGDLIVGDMLIDFKTREDITNPWLRETLFQLLGYALLDLDDAHGIRRVAVLLPRQPQFAVWSLDELLGGPAEVVLPRRRAELFVVLTDIMTA